MTKPRVLMLGWEFPPVINGGLGVACEGLCRALSGLTDLTLILPQANPAFTIDAVDLVGINQLPPPFEQSPKLKIFAETNFVPADLHPYADSRDHSAARGPLYGSDIDAKVIDFAHSAAEIADRMSFDLIHAHDWMTCLAGLEIKRHTGKPLVFHVHSLSHDRAGPGTRGWITEIEKTVMREADLIIAVSRYTRQICIEHYGAHPDKVVTIHNGVSPVSSYRSQKPFPEKLVLFLGRLTGQKGPDLFLEIATKVIEENPNVRFAMAGTGDQLRMLMAGSIRRGIRKHCHFTGFLDRGKIHHLLSMTDVYCMPSVSEPFGLSALEAAQFGIPSVISNQSGVAEVLPRTRKADSWDIDLMARHIIELTTNEELHFAASQEAGEDQKTLTWDRAASALIAQYGKLPPSY